MTNADVVLLVQNGVSEANIILKISRTHTAFDTSAAALVELKRQNVPEPVIHAMIAAAEHPAGGTGQRMPVKNGLGLFFGLGGDIPHGDFGQDFRAAGLLRFGMEYSFTDHISAHVLFEDDAFRGNGYGALKEFEFSGGGKWYFRGHSKSLRPFADAGIGPYISDPMPRDTSASTRVGGNFGGGVVKMLTRHWGIEGTYEFNLAGAPAVVAGFPSPMPKYSAIEGGFQWFP